jgi:hypothetical protein
VRCGAPKRLPSKTAYLYCDNCGSLVDYDFRLDGAWLVSDGIWQVAAEFKQLMEKTYQMLDATGVLAMDPDEAPPGVPLRMEYSTFCQGWVPHLRPADAERLLARSAAARPGPASVTGWARGAARRGYPRWRWEWTAGQPARPRS